MQVQRIGEKTGGNCRFSRKFKCGNKLLAKIGAKVFARCGKRPPSRLIGDYPTLIKNDKSNLDFELRI